jgi:hypothetical protein
MERSITLHGIIWGRCVRCETHRGQSSRGIGVTRTGGGHSLPGRAGVTSGLLVTIATRGVGCIWRRLGRTRRCRVGGCRGIRLESGDA